MDGQLSLFADENGASENKTSGFTVIDTQKSNEEKLKCFKSELKEVNYKTQTELFSGFNTIKAITFSYDIGFIDKIMKMFDYGEIILGADFLVQKDNKMNEFLTEVFTNSYEARQSIKKCKNLTEKVAKEELIFRTPRYILDHRKIYLLKADDGRTRVITTSANMTGRAWSNNQMETYEYDNSGKCYEEYEKDFETAWELSDDIPASFIASKKSDDLVNGNAILKKVKETGRTVVLKQSEETLSYDNIKYTIDHETIKEKYKVLLKDSCKKNKSGFIEIVPKTIEKIEYNRKKEAQKKMEVNNIEENYPKLTFDYSSHEAFLNDEPIELNPSDKEVKQDIDGLLHIFNNFSRFVGNTEKLQETHFKLINAIFCSPFIAKLRCTAKIKGIGTSSLPLFILAASSTANCGKTFMMTAALKMMTGKEISPTNKEDCKKDDIRNVQYGGKGIPYFIDELDNKYLAVIRDIIKNPEKCENYQIEEQPVILFASNDVIEPDEILRKRMVFLRFDGALPSTIDQNAYKGIGNALIRRLGTGFFREYLNRMIIEVTEMLNYMIFSKDIPDEYYPDLTAVSSDVILSIMSDYGYKIPTYMRHLTWNDDYSANAAFIANDTIKEIDEMYRQNKKAFIIAKNFVTIELGLDKESKKRCESWRNTLPSEMNARYELTKDCAKITVDRKELEARLGYKLGGISLFQRR